MDNHEEFLDDEIVFKDLKGTFGNFVTSSSFEVYYLMTTINISNLNILKEASSVLKFNELKFDEIVQRDIDHERVGNIFEEYLDKSKEKVVFFPPLLATLMITEKGKPIGQYSEIKEELTTKGTREYLDKAWDKKIKLNLPLSENNTGFTLKVKKEEKNYINYAATLSYIENDVALVVIDGQHRLKALQKLKDKYPDIKSINIPLCIFFSSNAIDSDENIVQDMRELFVTINNTGKKVSGHFITLLKDKSLSSIAVRELANKWKGMEENYSDCMLYFLEWNQRNDGRAYQVTRKYTITTVSILADVLKDYIFNEKKGITRSILNLEEIQEQLFEGIHYKEISEDNFSLNQITPLTEQINKYLVPSLDILFTQSLPYKEIIEITKNAIEKLDKKISDNITGAEDYKNAVLNDFRDINKFDSKTRGTFNEEFLKDIEYSDFLDYFRNNVFQQGYIIAWYKLVKLLDKEIIDITNAFCSSLKYIIFNKDKDMFNPRKEYTQQILYRGQKMIINAGIKDYISNIILASFKNETTLNSFIKYFKLNQQDEVILKEKLIELTNSEFNEYFEIYKLKNVNYLKSNYMYDLTLSDEDKQELNRLDIEAKNGGKEEKKIFENQILGIIENDIDKAKIVFDNLIR